METTIQEVSMVMLMVMQTLAMKTESKMEILTREILMVMLMVTPM